MILLNPMAYKLLLTKSKDFFYVCMSHLKDRHFCTPQIDEEALKKKREQEMAEEKERVKKEYEEKQRKKKEKEEKDKKDKDGDKGEKKDDEKDKDDEKKKSSDDEKDEDKKEEEEEAPRVFELKRYVLRFYGSYMRLIIVAHFTRNDCRRRGKLKLRKGIESESLSRDTSRPFPQIYRRSQNERF